MADPAERDRLSPAAYSSAAGDWETPPLPPPHEESAATLRLLTWNVWFGGHCFEERRVALLERLATLRPDVMALQEVTPELLEPLLAEPWVRAAYQVGFQRTADGIALGNYGVVILSRLPIRRLTQLMLPTTMGRALLVAELAGGLNVATVHLESMADDEARRVEQLGLIQRFLRDKDDVALVGDMNFPDGAPAESAALDAGYCDVWPRLHPGDPGYTVDSTVNRMRWQVKEKASHKRIDRVFLRSRRFVPQSISLVGTSAFDAADTFVSDHFGLLVELSPTSG